MSPCELGERSFCSLPLLGESMDQKFFWKKEQKTSNVEKESEKPEIPVFWEEIDENATAPP